MTETLNRVIQSLPPALQQEVEDFARFLLEKHTPKPHRKLTQDWAGMLKNYRAQYTALELQHQATLWRGD